MNLTCKYCGADVAIADDAASFAVCTNCGERLQISAEETIEFVAADHPAEAAATETPAFVSRYRVLDEVGRSGTSRVFRAHDTELDRLVALKLSLFASSNEHARFTRERQIVAKLRHPYIVPILDYGIENEREFVVSEYVDGESLRAWPAKSDLLSAEIVDFCAKLAEALEHAHEHNIIHRDLKPANIIIDTDGRPRIVDFGVALDLLAPEEPLAGRLVGTPAYMAPEQTLGAAIDARSDIYALGVIMYEMLTGQRPHDGGNIREMMRRIAEEPPPPMHTAGAAVPEKLERICRRCLEKSPDARFQSAAELADALYRFLASDVDELNALAGELRRIRLRNAALQKELSVRARMFIASQSEHQLYQALVEDLPLCVIRKDRDGKFSFANDTFCETVNLTSKELQDKTSSDVFSPRLAEKHAEAESHVMLTGRPMETIEEYEIGDQIRTFEVKRSPIRNFDAEIVGIQAIMWDVSAHARAEHALRIAKDAAEAASDAKSNFLANISHEIRTPMQAVIGLTGLLLRREQTEFNQHNLQLVHNSADALLVIINDILDFSRLEAGRLRLEQINFDLHALVNELFMLFEHEAKNKSLQFGPMICPQTPQHCVGDPTRVRQVLLNLLGNAFKFTESGSIRLVVQDGEPQRRARWSDRGPSERERVCLHFIVRDTGKGIPEEKLCDIFEPFRQEDGSITRRHGGTGLGLAITTELVSLMEGEIWVESRIGEGSDFHVLLDLHPAPHEISASAPGSNPAPPKPSTPHLRVLVVEDQEINQQFAKVSLEDAGHDVAIRSNGNEALEAFAQDDFDIILMDLQMPIMDGHTTARQIRLRETQVGGHIPIIAITAHASDEDRRRCVESGMDGYLSKPISYDALLAELARVTSQRRPASGSRQTPDNEVPQPSFDADKLLARVGGDREFLQRALAMLRVDRVSVENEISAAIQTENAEQLEASLHRLQGILQNFDATTSVAALREMKQLLDHGDWRSLKNAWSSAQQTTAALEDDLGRFLADP